MFIRLMVLSTLMSMIPGWVVVLIVLVGGFGTVSVLAVVAVDNSASSAASDFHYQCDSAIGPDPEQTETSTPAVPADSGTDGDELAPDDIPTTNPYAELAAEPADPDMSDWQRACVSAMLSAPYQLPPVRVISTAPATDCARQLAISQMGQRFVPSSGDASAVMPREVIYQASMATTTGVCGLSGAPAANRSVVPGGASAALAPASSGCPSSAANASGSGIVVLPNTVAGQALCGQRVAPSAISPGDLVFWDYRAHAPTRVGIAIGPTVMVTTDAVTGQVLEQRTPVSSDVRVKRVLESRS